MFDPNKIDTVIYGAGWKYIGESTRQPIKYFSTNLNITLNLIKCMKTKNIIEIKITS